MISDTKYNEQKYFICFKFNMILIKLYNDDVITKK